MWFHYDPELQTDCTMKKSPQGDSRGAITRKACFWKICCLTSGGCNFVWAPSPHQSWQMADPTCTCFCWTFLPGKRAFFFPLFPVRAHRESSNLGGGGFLHFEGYLALEFMFEAIVRLLRIWMIILKALYPIQEGCTVVAAGVKEVWAAGTFLAGVLCCRPTNTSPLWKGCVQTLVHQTLIWPRALLEAEWVEIRFEHGDIQKFPVVHKAAVSFCFCPFLDRLYQTLLPSDWWTGAVAEQNFKVHDS